MTPTLGRRDNPDTGLHEFYVEDNGEVYVFHAVKPGRVEKQRNIAAGGSSRSPQRQEEPPTPPEG